ncbi:hypothetical protein WJX73_009164 [Symbiochloris irregularis]|uniref:F-box domain-containing protein n=1 Tax=Symbiochloris irregularis TaxID=706552 RepID=A0AAW1Q4M6_9CHLO
MQSPAQRSRPDWRQLPSELLLRIFGSSPLRHLLQAELCCRSWFQVLRCPQGSTVWGDLTIKLDVLRDRISRDGRPASESQLYLRTCRWLKAHASGIASLTITASELEDEDEDEQDNDAQLRNFAEIKKLRAGFAVLVAAFSRLSVDLHVNFDYRDRALQGSWAPHKSDLPASAAPQVCQL